MKFLKMALVTVLAAGSVYGAETTGLVNGDVDAEPVRKVMNIVNFVRGCDPRDANLDLVLPLREEIKLNTKYDLDNTILLQYDVMLREDMMAEVRKADPVRTEFGVWFEVVKPQVERCGIEWHGRNGWAWDWFINPGLLMAYTHEERRRLCDELFRLFKEKFGHYPESVGSWLLDAYSMDYMAEKYGVKAFCVCREQDNVDAYGLRGGYFNGIYYASKRNMLSAAVNMKNAVKAPVIKMLTSDPIYNYAGSVDYGEGVYTLEPAAEGGATKSIVDWYFRIYAEEVQGALAISLMQTGQENSFGWPLIEKGLPYQMERIAALKKAGKLTVEKMCETGCRFMKEHRENVPQTQVALEDWRHKGRKSVWYNSNFYRANLLLDGEKLYIRDIHKMSDSYEEPFLWKVCRGWQALYFTPPVVDEYLFKDGDRSGVMAVEGAFASLAVETPDAETLKVLAQRKDGSAVTFVFTRGVITVQGAELAFEGKADFTKDIRKTGDALAFTFDDYGYRVKFEGEYVPTEKGYRLKPRNDRITLDLGAYPD